MSIFNIIKLIIVFTFLAFFASAQENDRDARKLFEERQFEKVVSYYEQQHHLLPDDRQVAYRYGVCLTETGIMGQKTLRLLLYSIDQDLPVDVLFYIGKNYHALSDFSNAQNYYQQFASKASKKEKKNLGLEFLISMAGRKENPYTAYVEVENKDSISLAEVVTEPVKPVLPSELADTLIEFRLTPDICYRHVSQFRRSDALMAFIEGWKGGNRLDSLSELTTRLRLKYAECNNLNDRQDLARQIIESENVLLNLKPEIEKFHITARETELKFWENAGEEQLIKLKLENDSLLNDWEMKHRQVVVPVVVADTVSLPDSLSIDGLPEENETEAESPEVTLTPLPVDQLVYKVQIGTYRGKLPPNVEKLFQRLSVLRKIDKNMNEKGDDVYTVGELTGFSDAVRLQQQIRLEGIKDAFVVVYHKGKRITLEEAKKIGEQ